MRRGAIQTLRLVFTAILLVLVVKFVDWRQGLAAMAGLSPGTLVAAVFLTGLIILLKAWKWHRLLKAAGQGGGWSDSLRSYMAGITLSAVTPMNLGELGRAFYLPGRSRSTLMGLAALDKALDLTAVLLFAVPGAFHLLGPAAAGMPAGAAVCAVAFLLSGGTAVKTLRRQWWMGRFRLKAARAALGLGRAGRPSVVMLLILALFVLFVVYVLYYVLLAAMSTEGTVHLAKVIQVCPLVMAGRLVPLTVSGLGMREGIAALLFPQIGVSREAGVQATFLVFILTVGCPALAGAFYRPRGRIGRQRKADRG